MDNPLEHSDFLPYAAVNNGNRYRAFFGMCMYMRGNRKAVVNLPVYSDINTIHPFVTKGLISEESKNNAKNDHVYLDCNSSFTGNSTALQITMQASSLSECTQLYDQCVPITSFIEALMAASPAVAGVLVDSDSRLSVMGIHNPK